MLTSSFNLSSLLRSTSIWIKLPCLPPYKVICAEYVWILPTICYLQPPHFIYCISSLYYISRLKSEIDCKISNYEICVCKAESNSMYIYGVSWNNYFKGDANLGYKLRISLIANIYYKKLIFNFLKKMNASNTLFIFILDILNIYL